MSRVPLFIAGLPHVTITPTGPLQVRVGDRVNFECVAQGDPPAAVHWEAPARTSGVGALPGAPETTRAICMSSTQ